MLKNEFEMKLFSILFNTSKSVCDTEEYSTDFVIPLKIWLVSPSILFESIRRVAIGIKIRIKIQINNEYFRYEDLSFLNLKKKIIDNGMTSNNTSYLTIDANARSINEIRNDFLFLSSANTNIKLISNKRRDSVKPKIEFSINLGSKTNIPAPISAYFELTNFLDKT